MYYGSNWKMLQYNNRRYHVDAIQSVLLEHILHNRILVEQIQIISLTNKQCQCNDSEDIWWKK